MVQVSSRLIRRWAHSPGAQLDDEGRKDDARKAGEESIGGKRGEGVPAEIGEHLHECKGDDAAREQGSGGEGQRELVLEDSYDELDTDGPADAGQDCPRLHARS